MRRRQKEFGGIVILSRRRTPFTVATAHTSLPLINEHGVGRSNNNQWSKIPPAPICHARAR